MSIPIKIFTSAPPGAETDVVLLPDEKSFIGEKQESCFKIVD